MSTEFKRISRIFIYLFINNTVSVYPAGGFRPLESVTSSRFRASGHEGSLTKSLIKG